MALWSANSARKPVHINSRKANLVHSWSDRLQPGSRLIHRNNRRQQIIRRLVNWKEAWISKLNGDLRRGRASRVEVDVPSFHQKLWRGITSLLRLPPRMCWRRQRLVCGIRIGAHGCCRMFVRNSPLLMKMIFRRRFLLYGDSGLREIQRSLGVIRR